MDVRLPRWRGMDGGNCRKYEKMFGELMEAATGDRE